MRNIDKHTDVVVVATNSCQVVVYLPLKLRQPASTPSPFLPHVNRSPPSLKNLTRTILPDGVVIMALRGIEARFAGISIDNGENVNPSANHKSKVPLQQIKQNR